MRENNGLNVVVGHKNGEEGNVSFYRSSPTVPKFTSELHCLCVAFVFGKLPELCINVYDRRIEVA